MNIDGIIYLSAPMFTIGLLVKDRIVVDGPPLADKWAIGQPVHEIWFRGKALGYTVLWLPVRPIGGSPDARRKGH